MRNSQIRLTRENRERTETRAEREQDEGDTRARREQDEENENTEDNENDEKNENRSTALVRIQVFTFLSMFEIVFVIFVCTLILKICHFLAFC